MKICKRCNQPVKVFSGDYDVFEGMHWICFHYEFEHGDYDPDEPCDDPSCPWNRINEKGIHIFEFDRSHTIRNKSDFIGLILTETQREYYPSLSFRVAIESFNNYVVNKSVWLERDGVLAFTEGTLKIERERNGSSTINSMSPEEFELTISSKRNGNMNLKYQLISQQNGRKAMIVGEFEIEGEEIKRLCKYFKDVVSFI